MSLKPWAQNRPLKAIGWACCISNPKSARPWAQKRHLKPIGWACCTSNPMSLKPWAQKRPLKAIGWACCISNPKSARPWAQKRPLKAIGRACCCANPKSARPWAQKRPLKAIGRACLLCKSKVSKAVSPEKTSEGNWLSLLFPKSKVLKAVRPFRSPFGKDFREFSLISNVWSWTLFWNKSDGRLWSELPCTLSVPFLSVFPPRKRWCKVGRWERWAADKLVRRFSLMDSNWSFSSPMKASESSSSSLARPKSKILRHFKCLNLPAGMATRELLARDICVVWHPNWLKASGSMLLRFVNTSCFCCNTAAKPQLSRWSPMALSEQRQGKQVKLPECPG